MRSDVGRRPGVGRRGADRLRLRNVSPGRSDYGEERHVDARCGGCRNGGAFSRRSRGDHTAGVVSGSLIGEVGRVPGVAGTGASAAGVGRVRLGCLHRSRV